MKTADCAHYDASAEAAARAAACEECGRAAPTRICTTCGHVGCCESFGAHNTAHFRASGHPVIREATGTPREGFLWCYACGDYLE